MSPAVPGYPAGAVARRLGVAVTTLRTWHQRYGLGPSAHEPGQHRRYTEQDIARLEGMQRLVMQGVPPGEAARRAGRMPLPAEPSSGDLSPGASPAGDRAGEQPADGEHAARGLLRAALRLDVAAVHSVAARAVRDLGVVGAWDGVLRPALAAIGDRHRSTGNLVDVEHIVSGAVSAVLGSVPRPPQGTPVRILLSCADEEQHSLPIEALAAALAAEGVPSRQLGARVPPAALAAAIRRTGPEALLLWSHDQSTADPAQLTALIRGPIRPVLVAASGPGWDPRTLPDGVVSPQSLTDAVETLTSAITWPAGTAASANI